MDFSSRTNGSNPTANIVGSVIVSGEVDAYNHSVVNVSGGSIGGPLSPNYNGNRTLNGADNSTINVTGEKILNGIFAEGNSTFNVSGGSVTNGLFADQNSTVNISGGSFDGNWGVNNTGTLNLFGSGLSATLINPHNFSASQYSLSGKLADGTDITGISLFVLNGTGASFHLFNTAAVPEPGSIAFLVGMAAVGIGVLRRRRK